MSRKKKTKKNYQSLELIVFEQDLSCEQPVDGTAMSVMECLEGRVSDELLELMKVMLLGFAEGMQLEIADNLLDFACRRVVHTTGCISADAVLKFCYGWIAAEKGFDLEFRNV